MVTAVLDRNGLRGYTCIMMPVYCLSIVFNGLCGYILAFGGETGGETPAFSLRNETVRLITGILTVIMGLLKILSPVAGNIPVIGDLVPALAGLAAGGILLFEFYRGRGTLDFIAVERIGELVEKYKKLTGFAAIGAAALHLIFYPVLFL